MSKGILGLGRPKKGLVEIHGPALDRGGFFYFLQKYIFDLKIYRNIPPAAPLPVGRDLAARQRGGRGFCAKTFAQIIAHRSLGPVARQRGGRAPQAARQRGGRPWPPGCGATGSPTLYKGWLVPPPIICITKIPETKKKEGERRSPAGFSSRRLQVTKIFLRFTNRLCCNYFC